MRWRIYENGTEINRIAADEEFVTQYCADNGYTCELIPDTEYNPVEAEQGEEE